MNTLIILAAIAAVAIAKPVEQGVALTQDTLGNYNLKYRTLDSSRDEQGFEDGKVVGTFTYEDKEGHHHTIKYVASKDGFTAHGDVPRPVEETPEVAHARAEHLAIVEKERALLPPLREESEYEEVFVPHPELSPPVEFYHVVHEKPHYVDNTHELEVARAEHLAAHKEALDTLHEAYRRISH